MKKTIACVVPSHKQELTDLFLSNWKTLLDKHNVEFILVDDSGEKPFVWAYPLSGMQENGLTDLTQYAKWYGDNDLISNKCAGVRQLGFLYIAQHLPDVEYILTFDTDTAPIGDPIQDHIDQLNRRVPISWYSTAEDIYLRGFPYGVREEAPVVVSHGVWDGVPDYDAPTQLLTDPKFKPYYPKGVIPKGIFAPICGMNLGFRRQVLPYIYFAPVGQFKGCERADDIWGFLPVIADLAKLNWAIVTGYARVMHLRASNVFVSMEKEAVGIRHNEEYWKDLDGYNGDPWFEDFRQKRKAWFELTYDKTQ